MEKKYCVYVHTNKTNGKRYVGITSMLPEKRWAKGRGYRSNVLFYRAINKYGWDGFDHEILASGLTKRTACKAEIRLIESMNLTNPEYGYNLDKGGNGSNRITEETRKKLSDGVKQYFKEHPDAKQKNAERLRKLALSGESAQRLRLWQNAHPEWAGEHSQRMKTYFHDHPEKGKAHSKKLKRLYADRPDLRELKSKQTKDYFQTHPEAREHAAQKTREYYRDPHVKQWKSEERKRFFAEHPEKKTTKSVAQFSPDGAFIAVYVSAREAYKSTGVSYKKISAVATGKQKTAGGYIWRFENELPNKAI